MKLVIRNIFTLILVSMSAVHARPIMEEYRPNDFTGSGEAVPPKTIAKGTVVSERKMMNSFLVSKYSSQSQVPSSATGALDLSQVSSFSFQDPFASGASYYESFPTNLGDGTLIVVWANPNRDNLYSSKSTDGGSTWSTPSFVNSTNNYCEDICGIRTSGRIIAVWQNNSTGLLMCYTDDDGATWSSPVSITNNTGDSNTCLTQTLDGKLWLFYGRFSAATSNDIFYRTSTNNGTSWSAEQTFLASSADDCYGIVVSKDASTLIAVYRDNSSGNYDIYSKTSTNGGATWSSPASIVNASTTETRPRVLRQSDGILWIIYQYYKNSVGNTTQSDIYYIKSTNGGSTWTTPASFTNYAGYDGWLNACLYNNKPFITFASHRWNAFFGQTHLWCGIIGTSLDGNLPPALEAAVRPTPGPNSSMPIKAYVDDESGIANVRVSYHLNGTSYGPAQMYDDGAHDDDMSGDNVWGASIGPFQLGDEGDFSVQITDINSNTVNVFVSNFGDEAIQDAGNMVLMWKKNSELGDEGNSPNASAYWPKSNGHEYLSGGGLWIGCEVGGEDRVMCYDYIDSRWSRTEGTPYTLAPGVSNQDGDVTYDDQESSSAAPIGLQVHQQSYQWLASSRDDFIIFKYTVKNRGTNGTLDNLFVSLWSDPDIAVNEDAIRNMAGYDDQRHLLYMYNTLGDPSGYFGIRLLGTGATPHTVNVYANGQDPRNDYERYQTMTSGIGSMPTTNADYRLLLTASPFSLAPDDSFTMAYGIVLGNGLAELRVNADSMEAVYNRLPTDDHSVDAQWEKVAIDTSVHVVNGGAAAAVGDLEDDGDLDIVTVHVTDGGPPSVGMISWYQNPGWTRHFVDDDIGYMDVADINQDGRNDIVAVNTLVDEIVYYQAPGWNRHAIGGQTRALNVKSADIDNDGNTDVVALSDEFGDVYWYEAPYWTPHVIGTCSNNAASFIVKDMDLDGDVDVVVCSENGILLFLAPYWEVHSITGTGEDCDDTQIDAGDIDGDGDVDVVYSNAHTNTVVWYENPSWAQHIIDSDQGEASGVALADLDNDGDLDVIASGNASNEVAWYESPFWNKHVIDGSIERPAGLWAADMDGDGMTDVIACTDYGHVILYKSKMTGIPDDRTAAKIPGSFRLRQNYPNPFNPLTKIQFELPKSGNITLNVYDVSGKVVKMLFSGFKPAGTHEIGFDAKDMATGIYYCRLQTGEAAETKKMVLLR